MEPKENLPSDEEPSKPVIDGNKNDKVDRIVNELRSLLSGQSIPSAEKSAVEKPISQNIESPKEDLSSSIFTDPFDTSTFPPTFPGGIPPANHKPVDPSFEPPPAHASGSSLPSDAEFWKGNVLGWEEKGKPVSAGNDSVHLPPGPEPIKIDAALRGENPYDNPGLESVATPVEKAPEDLIQEKIFSSNIEMVSPPPNLEAEKEDKNLVSEAPSEHSLRQMFPIPPEAPRFIDNDDPKVAPTDEAAPLMAPPGETRLPNQTSTAIDSSDDFYTASNQVKPEHLIQVACIVPAGEELKAQAFYRMLKESAAKSSRQFDVQPVFIHDWDPDRIDMAAWEKSASLSGADILFIVVHKSDADTFKPLMKKSVEPNLEKRLIYVEHISLRNLYSDLLIHLMEKPKWRK